jgi:hypothetical protein
MEQNKIRRQTPHGATNLNVMRIMGVTGWSFCTKASERVYITAERCETEFGGTSEL